MCTYVFGLRLLPSIYSSSSLSPHEKLRAHKRIICVRDARATRLLLLLLLWLTCSLITPILLLCARRKKTTRENERRKEIEYWKCIMKKKKMLCLYRFLFFFEDTAKRRKKAAEDVKKKRCFFVASSLPSRFISTCLSSNIDMDTLIIDLRNASLSLSESHFGHFSDRPVDDRLLLLLLQYHTGKDRHVLGNLSSDNEGNSSLRWLWFVFRYSFVREALGQAREDTCNRKDNVGVVVVVVVVKRRDDEKKWCEISSIEEEIGKALTSTDDRSKLTCAQTSRCAHR